MASKEDIELEMKRLMGLEMPSMIGPPMIQAGTYHLVLNSKLSDVPAKPIRKPRKPRK